VGRKKEGKEKGGGKGKGICNFSDRITPLITDGFIHFG
jgi:hypothetical protein